MSSILVAVPVTSHIHLFQQQLFWLSRWKQAYDSVEVSFFVDTPHPTIQNLLLLFQHVHDCEILNLQQVSVYGWCVTKNSPFLIIDDGGIPHPNLLEALVDINQPTRLKYCKSSKTAARWFPNPELAHEPLEEELHTPEPTEELALASHDADWLNWQVIQEQTDIKVALMLIRIFSFDHADVTGQEGNKFLSDHLREKLANRKKAIDKIKATHTNMLLHPVHVEPTMDGRFKVHALQETMRMGAVQSKAAEFVVTVTNGLIHQVQPKPLKLPEFPFPGAQLPTPTTYRPLSIGQKHRLVFSTIMRNEGDKFLHQVISHAAQYVDAFLVIDDCSTDNSIEVCRDAAGSVPLYLYSPPQPLYVRSEFYIRSLQWAMAAELDPEWVLLLDADEQFEDAVVNQLETVLSTKEMRVGFPKFDMWNDTHYRDDDFWCPHRRYWPHLIRYTTEYTRWHKAKVHSGRHPLDYLNLDALKHPLRIKHLGWSREAERLRKHEWYLKIDERPNEGNLNLYKHIADPNPVLRPWIENTNS